jgi:threonine/homoserine/homoserine lactone efflux protein
MVMAPFPATMHCLMNIAFLLTSLLVVASPGTGALYTISTGLTRGAAASVAAAVGCTLGIVPHMAAAILGLATAFRAAPLAFECLKYLGAAYLLYMAWSALRDRGALDPGQQLAARSPLKIIVSAILLNLLNPKLPIFFLAFLPQFIPASDPAPATRLLTLGGVFMLMTLAVFAAYGVFASFMRSHVLARPRVTTWLQRLFAAGFVALSVKLVL